MRTAFWPAVQGQTRYNHSNTQIRKYFRPQMSAAHHRQVRWKIGKLTSNHSGKKWTCIHDTPPFIFQIILFTTRLERYKPPRHSSTKQDKYYNTTTKHQLNTKRFKRESNLLKGYLNSISPSNFTTKNGIVTMNDKTKNQGISPENFKNASQTIVIS
jgi:hypothetical protein